MTGNERLRVLADFLESDAVPEERFDLGLFWCDDDECGSVGCAIGWAAHCPALMAEGFRMDRSKRLFRVGAGKPTDGFDAAKQFFDASIEDLGHLFMPGSYHGWPSRAAVVARIRAFLAPRGAA
jgi:hypothetical protein